MDQAFQPPLVNLFMLKGTNVFRQHGLCYPEIAFPQSEEV